MIELTELEQVIVIGVLIVGWVAMRLYHIRLHERNPDLE